MAVVPSTEASVRAVSWWLRRRSGADSGVDGFGEAHRGCGQVGRVGADSPGCDPGCDAHRGQTVQDRPVEAHSGCHGRIDMDRMLVTGEAGTGQLRQARCVPLRTRSALARGP